MPRSFSEALRKAPLLFEPVPPSARLRPERADQQLEAVAALTRSLPRIDALDVPELVDENHEGRPYYRSGDSREYALRLQAESGRAVIVNKIVAYLDAPRVRAWAEETAARGLRHAVLVGGTSRYIPYPGPPVVEANRLCHPAFEHVGGSIGNVAIPQREGEAHRMLAKTRAGSAFFTTQILFEAGAVLRMLTEYDRLCRDAELPPTPVLLSVAPIIDEGDVEFLRWLGADMTESAEQAILESTTADPAQASVDRALAVWSQAKREAQVRGLAVPLGVNVEQISSRHLEAAGRIAGAFASLLSG